MKLTVKLNEKQIEEKVTNDKFGTFVSHEWHRLINPYTPRETGDLMGEVDELPFQLYYKQEYAERMYNGIAPSGKKYEYRHINPFSTDHWDIKADEAGQKTKLYREINNCLKRS